MRDASSRHVDRQLLGSSRAAAAPAGGAAARSFACGAWGLCVGWSGVALVSMCGPGTAGYLIPGGGIRRCERAGYPGSCRVWPGSRGWRDDGGARRPGGAGAPGGLWAGLGIGAAKRLVKGRRRDASAGPALFALVANPDRFSARAGRPSDGEDQSEREKPDGTQARTGPRWPASRQRHPRHGVLRARRLRRHPARPGIPHLYRHRAHGRDPRDRGHDRCGEPVERARRSVHGQRRALLDHGRARVHRGRGRRLPGGQDGLGRQDDRGADAHRVRQHLRGRGDRP